MASHLPGRAEARHRLAIVGSQRFAEPLALEVAEQVIDWAITRFEPEVVVSGGADGIDTTARQVAASYGYNVLDGSFVEHLPANRRWAPDGFQARNLRIVAGCTVLLAVRCHAAATYGSGWAADEAQRQGRRVIRVVL
jgi:predicted Rossmann fold nucleotide-binding protein DprA/Smf involved in DNA uptake